MLLLDDRALLRRFRAGEQEALQAVYSHYGPMVARWVTEGFSFQTRGNKERFRGFQSPADVHDAIHEVFLKAFEERARTQYSGLKPFKGYLFVIARNVILRRLRIQRPEVQAAPEELEGRASFDPSPEELIATKQMRATVQTFLETLSDDDQRLLHLRFQERHSQLQTAKEMGWSRKKVRLRETALRLKLTRYLKRKRGSLESTEMVHEHAC